MLPLADIKQAHELMENNVNTGKIILKVEDADGKEELWWTEAGRSRHVAAESALIDRQDSGDTDECWENYQ